ncbi:RagB/SusD family nutrient uptake outer membrane protein [Chitinophaga nivalis]|uniref:RagB/SusD family nutrient uptake outer membrane protein n=1 Tax=Chitinophaga nivalis TaxID=2991709 RepID=A0ABT3INM1_9BACT|nr:RagB/SusD family nutrient uptake outer membrane protein [Chitinophaga nivalis]MCW3464766.1 RagB/SusD family nutrient uptake outer membrane protein [Chitinophaga nivalis]MCW3485543.1 RagB/SusD family nutrient uptake outer membrane protein [Chitinophaga nivalis]
MKRIAFNIPAAGVLLLGLLVTGCNKMLDIKDPVNSITTNQVFQSDEQAAIALNGLYSYLISGGELEVNTGETLGNDLYSAGGITLAAGHSADELYHPSLSGDDKYYVETAARITLQKLGYSTKLWKSAYKAIFNANALIEGVKAAKSKEFTQAYRQRVMGEALAVRAMGYFYLVNLFEKIPLALSIDYNDTRQLPSASPAVVYQQIISDLEEASGYLSEDYDGNNVERIRINKWYVKAMLARVYLYTKNYEKAWQHANDVINRTDLFKLESLHDVFGISSREVIFQLKQVNTLRARGNATPEGYVKTGRYLTPMLMNAFETGDNRKTAWTAAIAGGPFTPAGFSPDKYKINSTNFVFGGYRSEYYVVMRLAEMYLIRAEANMLRGAVNKNAVIDDLNAIRVRAGLKGLPYTLTDQQVTDAIAQERRIELFAEWGHRWLDLKRTNKATAVLSAIPYKQPWNQHQLLYPIPPDEIRWDNHLSQNIGY